MAFFYIDDLAWPLASDDGPHSSGAMRQLLRNVEGVHQERFAKCGTTYMTTDEGLRTRYRLCSAWPVAWGPKWMWFHPSEPVSTASVRLRVVRVGLSEGAGAGSGDLMRVCVTTGDARGRITVPPPQAEDAVWNTPASGGELLAATAVESTLSLTVRVDGRNQGDPADPLSGWVAFYLWTWSVISAASEDDGEIVEQEVLSGALGIVWDGTGPVATTNPMERVLSISSLAGNQLPGTQAGDIRQICHYRTTNLHANTFSDAAVYVVPPVQGMVLGSGLYTGSGPRCSIYTMGVMDLAGIEIEADPPGFPIAEAGVYTDEPIRWQTHQTTAQELERLVATRMPVWGIEPPLNKDVAGSSSHWTPWRLLSQDLRMIVDNGSPTSSEMSTNSASPSTLAAFPIANPPPSGDRDGYRAILTLFALRARPGQVWGYLPRVKLRLAAYDWTGAVVVAGDYGDWEVVGHANGPDGAGWPPLVWNVWGAVGCDDWQLRGCLIGSNMENRAREGSDWQRVSHHVLVLPETSITYPAVLKVQGYFESASRHLDLAVIGCGLAARSYADT